MLSPEISWPPPDQRFTPGSDTSLSLSSLLSPVSAACLRSALCPERFESRRSRSVLIWKPSVDDLRDAWLRCGPDRNCSCCAMLLLVVRSLRSSLRSWCQTLLGR